MLGGTAVNVAFQNWQKMNWLMTSLTLKPLEYLELREAFQGGFTHANARAVGRTLMNIGSFDFTSSYPAVMIAEKFPMAKGIEIGESTIDEIHQLSENYCCLFRVEFNEIVSKTSIEHPLSSSKCRHLDPSKQREDDCPSSQRRA